MARNRTSQDRDEKRAEIIDAATELFIRDGYEATSIGTLAKAAGITTNTIYWYFDDKDAVLVAVLRRVMRQAFGDYLAAPPPTLSERLLWIVEAVDRISLLMVTVHARVPLSAAVRSWHDEFHAAADAALLADIRAHLEASHGAAPPDAQLAPIPRLWTYAIEGMVSHELSAAERRELCNLLVRQLEAR